MNALPLRGRRAHEVSEVVALTNGGMTWVLVLTNRATRALRDVPRDDLERINAAFEEMRSDLYDGDIHFLKGTERTLRRRIGAWRILFEVRADRRLIIILGVVRRGSNTY